ncbi:unnamed protein product [Xylocopa violacea]|uniref:Uncharacterized protein n=1 Tax=Xylocopa violacea TaxID=135666 RepID=A0ABP1NZK2_XYLVO
MASSALEEKINKIRQQNEEIRRRYEEVEEDKKNAAKLNALVQMVPSTDWPERKEPPEFSNLPKTKPKSTKEKHEYTPQPHAGEGRKVHSFAQGEGPPPDPKYNFLADSEREEPSTEYTKENSGNRSYHKVTRGSFRKKMGGRDSIQKDSKPNKGGYRDESQPGYDAWRAERNRIDEDRISRQRTAEGNWRREWDNDKVHIIDDAMKKSSRPMLGDFTKKDYKDSDRRYHANNNEHVNYSRGGGHGRPHRGSTKNFYSNYENRSHNTYDQHRSTTTASMKTPMSPTSEERTVIATEKSLKVTVNQNNATKGPVMSVKVNSPNIAGTGRVGPRQRSRITYSHSDADAPPSEGEHFFRQKSFEDKSKGTYFNNQKFPNLKRSHSQKKKENETKYQYHSKKDSDGNSHKQYENEFRSHSQKDQQKSYATKSPKPLRGNVRIMKHDSSNVNIVCETQKCSTSNEVKLEQNIECNIEPNVEPVTGNNIELNVEHDVEQNIKHNVEYDTEYNTKSNVAHNIECDIKENIQHDITTETLQENKSNEIEVSNVKNEEINIENETTNEVSSKIEEETKTTSLTSTFVTDNPEHNVKYDTSKDTFDNKSECSDPLACNVTEEPQESSHKSSEALVPNNNLSNKELVPNEASNDVVNVEETFTCEVEQSSRQVINQFVNDNCDNIENEITIQRSTEEVIDNSASSLADKTNSVIEINNQLVQCNKELVQNEALNAEKETDTKNESSDKNLEEIVNSCESKEKAEETKDGKEEKGNEEDDKMLQ